MHLLYVFKWTRRKVSLFSTKAGFSVDSFRSSRAAVAAMVKTSLGNRVQQGDSLTWGVPEDSVGPVCQTCFKKMLLFVKPRSSAWMRTTRPRATA